MNKFLSFLFQGSDQQIFARLAGLFAPPVYMSWSIIYNYVLNGRCDDPILERFIVSSPAFLVALASFKNSLTPYLTRGVNSCIFLYTGHLFWLVFRNDVAPPYQIGMLVLVAAITPYFQTMKDLTLYMCFLASMIGVAVLYAREKEYWIFYGAVITVGLMSFLGLNLRLKILSKLAESRQKTMVRNKDIESILDNINQGIMPLVPVNEKLIIGGDFSKYLTTILDNGAIKGQDPFEAFFRKTNLNAEQLTNIETILTTSIGEDNIQWETNLHILPSETKLTVHSKTYDIEIDWTAVLDPKDDTIQKILVVLRDITELKQIKEQSKDKELEVDILTRIVSVDPNEFTNFCSLTHSAIERTSKLVRNQDDPNLKRNLAYVFRELHTLKGLARSFNFEHISLKCHEAEYVLQKITKLDSADKISEVYPELLERINILVATFEKYLLVNKDILKRDNNQEVKLGVQFIEDRVQQIRSLLRESGQIEGDLVIRFVCELESLYKTNLRGLLKSEIDSLPSIAEKLGKNNPNVIIECDEYFINEQFKESLKGAFIHIFRNSLDHGIETPKIRREKGKPEAGTITISIVNTVDGQFIVSIEDDGQGLKLSKIKEIGVSRQLTPADEQDPQKIANLIFNSEFSTNNQVTEISGRGVGMDVVKGRLTESGMKVDLKLGKTHDDGNRAFAIEILCPSDTFIPRFGNSA